EELAEESTTVIDPKDDIKTIFAFASEWEVGSSKDRVRTARKILLEREDETIEYIIENKLDTKSGLVYRAIKEFAQNCTDIKPLIKFGLSATKERIIKNTIRLIGDLEDETYLTVFKKFLEENNHTGTILSSLGKIATPECTKILGNYIHDENVFLRVICSRSLKKINSETSLNLLMQMEKDECFLIDSMIRIMRK
ncbi:MAG: hypothetical protein U9N34_09910, partial [Candidatus Cloacimonadota bacterium]|nr:hypothetical protein [Candidatus Cloacimonadota bacterium]